MYFKHVTKGKKEVIEIGCVNARGREIPVEPVAKASK